MVDGGAVVYPVGEHAIFCGVAPIADLSASSPEARLAALRDLVRRRGAVRPPAGREVNCHVHTIYSFSPYSPSAAAERAQAAGLAAVGVMDHDSFAGAAEMREAGRILGLATTAGTELRVSAAGTRLARRKLNNPDSPGVLYMTFHGVPARSAEALHAFLRPVQASREKRDMAMVERLNGLLPGYGLSPLDWERDVLGVSQANAGGTITERHILFAVAKRIVERVGRGPALVDFLRASLGIVPPPRIEAFLRDPANDALLFDLLGLLKSSFIEKVFIQPDADECVPASAAVRFAEEIGAIPCYAYLGDVTDSPTGDKKTERFEDGYLEELMEEASALGFRAITYMPPRNTLEQLRRLQKLCDAHGFMQISGVDINSPRQSFNCPQLLLPDFAHLIGATWAVIAHERLADADARYGLFSPANPLAGLPLERRIAAYAEVGQSLDTSEQRPAVEHPLVRSWG
jgi:hypothetical protein